MGRTRALAARGALAIGTIGVVFACYGPTSIEVRVSADFPCPARMSMYVGTGVPAAGDVPAAEQTASSCRTLAPTEADLGSLVLTPGGDRDASMRVTVVSTDGADPNDCLAARATGCIISRRLVSFRKHESFDLPIRLYARCRDVPCSADRTCVDGRCVSATPEDVEAACPDGSCEPKPIADSGHDVVHHDVQVDAPITVDAGPCPVGKLGLADKPLGKVAYRNGALFWPAQNGFTRFDIATGTATMRGSNPLVVNKVLVSTAGNIWIATDTALYRWDDDTSVLTPFRPGKLTDVVEQGGLLYGTAGTGSLLRMPEDGVAPVPPAYPIESGATKLAVNSSSLFAVRPVVGGGWYQYKLANGAAAASMPASTDPALSIEVGIRLAVWPTATQLHFEDLPSMSTASAGDGMQKPSSVVVVSPLGSISDRAYATWTGGGGVIVYSMVLNGQGGASLVHAPVLPKELGISAENITGLAIHDACAYVWDGDANGVGAIYRFPVTP